jgi:hypothetical protein
MAGIIVIKVIESRDIGLCSTVILYRPELIETLLDVMT